MIRLERTPIEELRDGVGYLVYDPNDHSWQFMLIRIVSANPKSDTYQLRQHVGWAGTMSSNGAKGVPGSVGRNSGYYFLELNDAAWDATLMMAIHLQARYDPLLDETPGWDEWCGRLCASQGIEL